MNKAKMQCTVCGAQYDLTEMYRCPKDGGELTFVFDYQKLAADTGFKERFMTDGGMWKRFADILPLADTSAIVTLGEGGTPLVRAENLGRLVGIPNLYLKLECCNPTGSFKDRQISLAISNGNQWGKTDYATVSSGNVGNALSAYCASKGFNANVWVSEDTPNTKYQQIQIYGCKVFLYPVGVDSFGHFFLGLNDYCRDNGMVPMISARPVNPYMVEGCKTISFEIYAALGRLPDCVASPIGGGGLFGGLWKGFCEMKELEFTDRLPVQCGAQKISNMMPILHIDEPGFDASGYALPLDGRWAKEALRSCGGIYNAVNDAEIDEAQMLLATREGVFAEPMGATGFAGLLKASRDGKLSACDTAVCIVTGAGLKDAAAMERLLDDTNTFLPIDRVKQFDQCSARLKRAAGQPKG